MGTPEFAVESLKALINAGVNVVAVVTVPDKPAGRGQKIQESDVKRFALQAGLPVLQPDKLKDENFLEQLRSYAADLQVVVAFRMLPEVVWAMPRYGTINLHASLLPQYRGAAPINWAVINGEKESGVTTFFIEKEIDTGKIIFNERVPITDEDNAGTFHDKLMHVGAGLLVRTVEAICAGNYPQVGQNGVLPAGTVLRPAPKIFKETCRINWNEDVETIWNFIRGLSPYPAAWTQFVHNQNESSISVKIFDVKKEKCTHSFSAGKIITDGKRELKVAVSGGYIQIHTLQAEGKKRLAIDEFLRGFKEIELYSFR
jgi:methionyl-tRNA formyltransferase